MREFSFSSELCVHPETLWAHARTLEGVNAELWPLVRMTSPESFDGKTLEDAEPGKPLFRSWILLFGFIPIDYDDICIQELFPAHGGFLEESTMLTQRRWSHRRTIEAAPVGCRVTDKVGFVPRVPFTAWLFWLPFRLAFWNRHRNLRRMFGVKSR
jgi:hypothetical protein